MGYFQPIIKEANSKLKCQKTAYSFIKEINLLKTENPKTIEMLTVNYCNGGNELDYLRKVE